MVSHQHCEVPTHVDNPVRSFAEDTSLYIIADNDILASSDLVNHDLGIIKQRSHMWAVEFGALCLRNLLETNGNKNMKF